MKYETYENFAFVSYLLFILLVFVMTVVSLFVKESGSFVLLVFGIFGVVTIPIALIIAGLLAIVIIFSFINYRKLTTGYRFLTITTLLYIGGSMLVPNMPWGGASFAEIYGPVFTGISILYVFLGVLMLFSKKYQYTRYIR